jgi:phage-related minor tail protein
MNKRATKRKSATENSIFKFLTVSSVSSDSIVKGIIDDIINMAVKTAEVEKQKTKYFTTFY